MNLQSLIFILLVTVSVRNFSSNMHVLDNDCFIIQIDDMHHPVFRNLQLCYECEFSPITQTQMTSNGDYDQEDIASHWSESAHIYLFYKDQIPVGFCVVNDRSMVDSTQGFIHDIAEFYITPFFRKNGLGALFARKIIMLYEGSWEIRQLPELEKTARQFWLKVIEGLPHTNFQEIVNHSHWCGFLQKFDVYNR